MARKLTDAEASAIRAELPFGPVSEADALRLAADFNVHHWTILNIGQGRSYARPKACPDEHPLRLTLNAKVAARQRVREKAKKHRSEVGA